MKLNNNASAGSEKRKFALLLPLLLIPFLTMFFWALGGGKGPKEDKKINVHKGFNMDLPSAHLKSDKGIDKMAYYLQAAADSLKLQQRSRWAPDLNQPLINGGGAAGSTEDDDSSSDDNPLSLKLTEGSRHVDPNEKRVYERLHLLNSQLTKKANLSDLNTSRGIAEQSSSTTMNMQGTDIDRLENMMRAMKNTSQTPNDEMTQMNSVLDKLLAVQRPDLYRDTSKTMAINPPGPSYPVGSNNPEDPVTRLLPKNGHRADSAGKNITTGSLVSNASVFNDLDGHGESVCLSNMIEAEIAESQTLVSGAVMKIQLSGDINIRDKRIQKGTVIAGVCNLNNERLALEIRSIKYNGDILPVHLRLYDMDGLTGIYIPGAIGRDAAKQTADQTINGFGLTTLDPSIGAQAASAGIQMAKTIASKKVRLVRVSVKAGYKVLLMDENRSNNNH